MLNLKRGLAVSGLSAFFILPVEAQTDLNTRIEKLEQELIDLKHQLQTEKEAAAEKAKTAPIISAGAGGFSLRTGQTNFFLRLRGYVQADARFFPNDSAAGTANDTFLLRRVRPIFEGTVYDKFDFKIMPDFGSNYSLTSANDPFIQDAFVNARFKPWFQVQIGKMKGPVDLERLQSAANLLFVERGHPTSLAPNRETGVLFQGDVFDSKLYYGVGIFNGVQDSGSEDFETVDDDKEVAGRIFATPFKDSKTEALRGLGFGVGGSYGNQSGTPGILRSPGQQAIFSYTGVTNAVVSDGVHWRIAPQAYYYYGPFGVFGQYIISDQTIRKPAATAGKLRARNSAWMIAGSYFLTGETNSWKAVSPNRPFDPTQGAWGAFELAARVHHLDIDNRVFPNFASAATSTSGAMSFGAGLNWHLNKNFKFNLDYEHTDFEGGSSPLLQNGEDVIMTRAQISF
jgi:phosphate-selective porin OprO/OprP